MYSIVLQMERPAQDYTVLDMKAIHSEAFLDNAVFDIVKAVLDNAGINDPEAYRENANQEVLDWFAAKGDDKPDMNLGESTEVLAIFRDFKTLFGKNSLSLTLDNDGEVDKRVSYYFMSHAVSSAMLEATNFDDADSVVCLLKRQASLDRNLRLAINLNSIVQARISDKVLEEILRSKDFNVGGLAVNTMYKDRLSIDEKIILFHKLRRARQDPENHATDGHNEIGESGLVKDLVESNQLEYLYGLVLTDQINPGYIKEHYSEVGDDYLIPFLKLETDTSNIESGLRYIDDPRVLRQLAEEASSFTRLSEESASEFAYEANQLATAIESEPILAEVAPLNEGEENKFVVAVDTSSGEPKIVIAWSNTKDYFRHKEILSQYCQQNDTPRISIDNSLVSGGHLAVQTANGNTQVTFSSASGDYGRYNPQLLQRYSQKIGAALAKSLDAERLTFSFV